jgi:hypothetical protein
MTAGRVMTVGLACLLSVTVVWLQVLRDRLPPLPMPPGGASVMYVRSPAVVSRMVLSYDALAADIYWLRAIQHYGGTKRSTDPGRSYDQLYPLLDLTTSLDPRFKIAYRFGGIFLAEPWPSGAGRADLAIALLEKGLRADPSRWEYAQDLGFVYYWWYRDYMHAAEWFERGGDIPGAPNWLKPLAAVTLTQGGSRASSRRLWQEVLSGADVDWLRRSAVQRLRQLDVMDQLDQLGVLVERYTRRAGHGPRAWQDLIRAGDLPGVPVDSEGYPYLLEPGRPKPQINPQSPLAPLPAEPLSAAPLAG